MSEAKPQPAIVPDAPDAAKQAQKPDVKPAAAQQVPPVAPPASYARPRRRHRMLILSFLLIVVLPCMVAGVYLWTRAADQYASYLGFSVRTEEVGSAVELLGGITELSGSSSSDTDILYKFLQSQELVAKINQEVDLSAIWSKAGPDQDPVFSYHPPGTIEDLTEHWLRKVKVYYDSGSGLIDVRVLAFTAEDAHLIGTLIFDKSSKMINALSAIAREDALRYAREELDTAVERVKQSRRIMTEFRLLNQIVDPEANIQGQVLLISSLQNQLADALIELDLLLGTSRQDDPRITQLERKIEVIEYRISEERRKFGSGDTQSEGVAYARMVGEYETLAVERQFAEQSYRAAQATYDAALAEARRQSRYLAAHVNPTLAERAEYPKRLEILSVFALFAFLLWAVLTLVAYSLKDRR